MISAIPPVSFSSMVLKVQPVAKVLSVERQVNVEKVVQVLSQSKDVLNKNTLGRHLDILI